MSTPRLGFTLAFAQDGESADLDIFDFISPFGGVTAQDVVTQLNAASTKAMRVRINSRGGDIVEGLAIHNLLAKHEARISVEVIGIAGSMASVIAMAGDTITMEPESFMMIHNPWGVAMGEAQDLRDHADLLDKMHSEIVGIYARRSGQKPSKVRELMTAETWMTAKEAKANGFADKIRKPKPRDAQKAARAMAETAQAFCAIDPELLPGASAPTRPDTTMPLPFAAGATTTTPPEPRAPKTEPERSPMALSNAILLALGLTEGANDQNAVAAIDAMKKERDAAKTSLASFEALTGKTGDEALGTARAWKASHEKLPTLEAEHAKAQATAQSAELAALLKEGRDQKKLSKAEADKLESQVKAHWAAKADGSEPPDDAMSLGAARSFVAAMAPKSHLAAAPAASTPPNAGTAQNGAMTHNGKAYEQMTSSERIALAKDAPDLMEQMRDDAYKRGSL